MITIVLGAQNRFRWTAGRKPLCGNAYGRTPHESTHRRSTHASRLSIIKMVSLSFQGQIFAGISDGLTTVILIHWGKNVLDASRRVWMTGGHAFYSHG